MNVLHWGECAGSMELKLPLARPPPSRVAETNDDAQISKLCVG